MDDRRSSTYYSLVVIAVILPRLVDSLAINNHVLSQPDVVCLEEGIRILINVEHPFHGHIYVKGMFFTSGCHLDLTTDPHGTQEIVFDVPYRGECNVRRERSLNPSGISYRTTVIVQFHHLFLTKVDGAYSVTCFYQEAVKQVNQQIEVSMLPTTELVSYQEMPTCIYQVLSGSIDGPPVRHARIGDKLIHKWSCESGPHGILVHSCFARNGVGSEYRLLDERGCALDPVALGQLAYTSDLSMAHAEVHAFKFADQMLVHFQCQITICTKVENGCEGITPPTCYIDPHLPPPVIVERPNYQYSRPPPDPVVYADADRDVASVVEEIEEARSGSAENQEFRRRRPATSPPVDGDDDHLEPVKESYPPPKKPQFDQPQAIYRPLPSPSDPGSFTQFSLSPSDHVEQNEGHRPAEPPPSFDRRDVLEQRVDSSQEHESRIGPSPPVLHRRRPHPIYPVFREGFQRAPASTLPPLPGTAPEEERSQPPTAYQQAQGRPQSPTTYQQVQGRSKSPTSYQPVYSQVPQPPYYQPPPEPQPQAQRYQYGPQSGAQQPTIPTYPPIRPRPRDNQNRPEEEASVFRHNVIGPSVKVIDPVSQPQNSMHKLPPIDGEEIPFENGANLKYEQQPKAKEFRPPRVYIQEVLGNSVKDGSVGKVLMSTVPPAIPTAYQDERDIGKREVVTVSDRRTRSIGERPPTTIKSRKAVTKSAKVAANASPEYLSDDVLEAKNNKFDKLQLLKTQGNTLDVTADDLLVFSLEEQPFEDFAVEVEEAIDGEDSGVQPQILKRRRQSDVCMTKTTLTQLTTVIALFFITLFTLCGFIQRRYYLDKLDKQCMDEFRDRDKY